MPEPKRYEIEHLSLGPSYGIDENGKKVKLVTCYIRRQNDPTYPWLMECYPETKRVKQRDIPCLTRAEGERIAEAIYGDRARVMYG